MSQQDALTTRLIGASGIRAVKKDNTGYTPVTFQGVEPAYGNVYSGGLMGHHFKNYGVLHAPLSVGQFYTDITEEEAEAYPVLHNTVGGIFDDLNLEYYDKVYLPELIFVEDRISTGRASVFHAPKLRAANTVELRNRLQSVDLSALECVEDRLLIQGGQDDLIALKLPEFKALPKVIEIIGIGSQEVYDYVVQWLVAQSQAQNPLLFDTEIVLGSVGFHPSDENILLLEALQSDFDITASYPEPEEEPQPTGTPGPTPPPEPIYTLTPVEGYDGTLAAATTIYPLEISPMTGTDGGVMRVSWNVLAGTASDIVAARILLMNDDLLVAFNAVDTWVNISFPIGTELFQVELVRQNNNPLSVQVVFDNAIGHPQHLAEQIEFVSTGTPV